ncbi:interferon-induced, double-stranded RNA-activated protein kinase-like [Engraulis encrasicolus]|uniref:interferon-induced, double-stranded RNA-activated protein kinase-like n=1 Tax=Engraulis encrasicolus TaxID=184585 RepID=UPI002FD30ED6
MCKGVVVLMNCVAKLNEYGQKKGVQVRFEDANVTAGPDHVTMFTVRATVNGTGYRGVGRTKKEAKEKAALKALEYLQRTKTSGFVSCSQPSKYLFTIRASVDGTPYPEGVGKNKKEAKENAAQKALEKLLKTETNGPTTPSTSQTSEIPTSITQPNYQCWLNEHSHKTRVNFTPVERVGSISAPHCCRYESSDGKSYPEAFGKNKKEAKEEAARLVYVEILREQGVIESSSNGNTSRQHEQSSRNVSPPSNAMEQQRSTPTRDLRTDAPQNFIGEINHYCQQRKLTHDYKLVDRRGQSHIPEKGTLALHTVMVSLTELQTILLPPIVINKHEYPEGRGKTAKEAKQQAAQLAWNAIQEASQSESLELSKLRLSEDDSPSPTPETLESQDMDALRSNATSESDSIVFKDSSKDVSNAQVAPQSPAQNKPKILLAPNFNNFPNKKVPCEHCKNPGQATKSRFEEEFDSIESIGKGGFGRVFKARNKCDETNYAVKIVKSTDKARREVIALAKLQHPHIVRYQHCWIEKTAYRHEGSDSSNTSTSGSDPAMEYLYIKMEWCEGNTLATWIDEKNRQQDPHRRQAAQDIVTQIVDAVVYIHSKSLIHRDLKPANIMFGKDRKTVKIGDFGLVTVADNDDEDTMMERTKRTGTKSYMSPEQNQSKYDHKVDIFALGLIYFELIWFMHTKSERRKIWDDVREQNFPKEFSDQFCFELCIVEIEHELIKEMLCDKPWGRPDAKDLAPKLEKFTSILDQNGNERNATV